MSFPVTRGSLDVELYLSGAWVDVSADVRQPAGVEIARGRSDEAAQPQPSTCALTLNNRDGRYSPRNPTGPYYGQLGRNTPVRVSVHTGTTRMVSPDGVGGFWTTPDSAAQSITGDIDVRADIRPRNWRTAQNLAYKWLVPSQRSYFFLLNSTGTLALFASADGATSFSFSSTAAVPAGTGRLSVRVTLDVNNGAAGKTAVFYTGSSLDGPWTQLGDPVILAGTTAIFDSTSPVTLDSSSNRAETYGARILNGIAGSVVGNPDFTVQTDGATSFADSAGVTWTKTATAGGANNALVTDRRVRFVGEVSSWPQRWAARGADVWTPLEAAGVTRRLSQGATPDTSVMYRALTTLTPAPTAYWPCEDESGATSAASALGGPPLRVIGDPPAFGSFDGFACSKPVLVLPSVAGSGLSGLVPTHTGTGAVQLRFLLHVPDAGVPDLTAVCDLRTTGTVGRWRLRYGTGGTLALLAYSASSGAEILNSGAAGFASDGTFRRVSVELTQDGTGIDWAITTLDVGETVGGQVAGTLAANTVVAAVRVNFGIGDLAVGHVSVHDVVTSIYDLTEELNAYSGETAGRRIERVCAESGIPFTFRGDLDDTVLVGPQPVDTPLGVMRMAADTDQGILYEARDTAAVEFRTAASLCNQTPAVTLAYSAAGLAEMEPRDDDQRTRNDVTVTRVNGSSDRRVLQSGPLSIQDPPNGVGRGYDESATVNVADDTQLPDHAGWRLRLGTVDESRYPTISLNLSHPGVTAVDLAAVVSADVGDRMLVTGPPAWLPPDDISQLWQGCAEALRAREWALEVNCAPESPYQVGAFDDASTASAGADPSFEAGTNGAIAGGFFGGPAPTLTQSATHPSHGSNGLRIAWATGGQGQCSLLLTALVIGREYTVYLDAWVPTGDPDISLGIAGITFGAQYTTKNAPFTMSVTFTATTTTHAADVIGQVPGAAGDFAYVDLVTIVETGKVASTYSSDGSTLASSATSTATSLSVATAAGPLWTTDTAEMPVDLRVAGERVLLRGVTGASSPQTFTVLRSRNGVVKAQSSGAVVELFRPAYYAL